MISLFSTMNTPKIKSDRVHFKSKAIGFSDSLPIFRQKFPQMKTYSQTYLMSEILQEQYDAHNAKEDVSLLYKLISTNATAEDITSNSFTTEHVLQHLEQFKIKKKNLITFNSLKRENVFS